MRSVTKIGIASLALLGTIATVAPAANAQGYGYGYGYGRGYGYGVGNNGPTPGYCGPHTSQMTNWILDPQTGRPITQDEYLSRYPSNPATWSYDCNTGLWTDPGLQANSGYYQGPGYYSQGPAYRSNGRGYHRESRNDNNGHGRGHQHRNG